VFSQFEGIAGGVQALNESISPIDLIFGASAEVQVVIYILLVMSIISWVIIVQRWMVMSAASRGVDTFEDRFWSGIDLSQLYKEGSQLQKEGQPVVGMENIFRAGFKEFMRLRQKGNVDKEAVMNGAQRAMRVAYSREEDKLERHLSFLATVGSVSPYIGLFGTVIGIMNAFLGLATQSQTTLQAVAPGIAEALIVTAIGLFAAIPAVVAYNRYASKAETITGSYVTFSDEFSSILHRQLYSH
jgi:biopolymer transport protein TolQ